ncbi:MULTISPECIES: inorganic phosphate transporter [unclassified Nostoc]|uniref:inorganic phosphate transporter n=1 Tax=unclassified Nostoc TaxID=2593658 RepID=UPI000CF3580D|nr:inorganic phosphate transporter [Nostoc sp. 'Peltigera membranacea cyanobiont' N6]AVH64735.1 phosphate transporter PitA [Nostoc sp. 'Peltigera membranacea cyanobiont' N6]
MEYLFLALALSLALGFEFVNGFHDTANAVATVIYTNTLKPNIAVVWSGCWNLIGVLTSSGAVAFGIIALLPVELVLNVGSSAGFAMVFALLISAIMWNLGTWYLGLPASSSHTLIGSIMGVGLANSMLSSGHVFGEGVNWAKAQEVFTSLLVSPIVGFTCAALLLLLAKILIKRPELYRAPDHGKAPPTWVRGLLILTCTGVSFAHGSNDGQKGMGLIMLILVGILPGMFALNIDTNAAAIAQLVATSNSVVPVLQQQAPGTSLNGQNITDELSNFLKPTAQANDKTFAALAAESRIIGDKLAGKTSFKQLSKDELSSLRTDMYLVAGTIGKLDKEKKFTDPKQEEALTSYKTQLDKVTKFIPNWVKFAVAIALGLGTMIGWKRIVVTVGEKIGKDHLTYAQGASAELVAMTTIGAADYFGLPVSTTHVLSSGVAGTMAANHSGLQMDTLRNLLLAWVLTLPVCVLLGSATYAGGLYIVLNILGLK